MPPPAVSADARLFSQRFIKTILLVVLFCFTHLQAAGANPTYTVTQNTELTFGTMQIPGGSVTDIISTAGAQSGTGTYLYGTVSEGDFTIKCTGTLCTNTMSLSITGGTGGCFGVIGLSAFQGNYNSGAKTGALPFTGLAALGNGGTADFKVGATATYDQNLAAGNCVVPFTIGITDSGSGGGNFLENASISFDVGLALNKNSDINFGIVTALNASTYRISTAGAVTTVSGTGSYVTGATSAGNIQIVGSTTDGITISVGGYTANNGVTPANAQCSYNGGAAGSCSISGVAAGSGKTLLVGVDVAADGTQAGGTTAAPSFTVNVAYQ